MLDYNYQYLEKKQRSDQDRRHMMSASVVWKPDYYNGENLLLKNVLNGWTLTSTITTNSGQPFTVTTGVDNYFNGQGNNRPSLIPGTVHAVLHPRSRVAAEDHWFDKTVYCIAGTTTNGVTCPGTGPLNLLGLEGPMQLSDPGYRDVDASLVRDIQIHDRLKFQFRGEAVNVFNLTNLGAPTAAMNNVNFGKITGSGGSNRVMQVGGRILF